LAKDEDWWKFLPKKDADDQDTEALAEEFKRLCMEAKIEGDEITEIGCALNSYISGAGTGVQDFHRATAAAKAVSGSRS
jgi:hypothetical protein